MALNDSSVSGSPPLPPKATADPAHRRRHLRTRWWHPDYAAVRPLWDELEDALKLASGRLLDLGCGNAPYQPWYENHVASFVRADHPPVSKRTDVACDAHRLPFLDAAFDTVLCTQMLEHVARPWEVSAELHRITRPGGIVILSCPQYWPEHEQPYDFFRFTSFGLKSLFPDSSWEWLRHRRQGSSFAVVSCALWLSLGESKRWHRALALLLNPILLLLDNRLKNPADTTNHLVVIRKLAGAPSS